MKNDELSKQVEFYSNAIIGFVVLQGLGFCYQVGTSEYFHIILNTKAWISIGLSFLFFISTITAGVVNQYPGKTIVSLNIEHREILETVFKVKTAIIVIFNLIPFVVTIGFVVRNFWALTNTRPNQSPYNWNNVCGTPLMPSQALL